MDIKRSSTNISHHNGITTTVETLFLLSISAILVAIVLLNFYGLQKSLQETSSLDQAYSIGAKITGDIYSISLSEGDFAKKELMIPDRIGGEQYLILLVNDSSPELVIQYRFGEARIPISPSIKVINSSATSYDAYLVMNNSTIEVKNE
jgi:hypothetical protein